MNELGIPYMNDINIEVNETLFIFSTAFNLSDLHMASPSAYFRAKFNLVCRLQTVPSDERYNINCF